MTAQDIKSMPEFQAFVLAVEALHQKQDFTIELFCDGSGALYEGSMVQSAREDAEFEVQKTKVLV